MSRPSEQGSNLLQGLEIFVVVAEQGSMTAAGATLGMTQSAVSQQIHNLEEAFGARLFDRDLRPLRVTPAGALLRERAMELLQGARDLRASLRSTLSIPVPHLRFGVLSSIAGSLVAPLVFELIDRLSVRNVSVWSGFGNDHQRALANRDLDLILIADAPYSDATIERHEVFSEPFILIAPQPIEVDRPLASILAEWPLIRHSRRSPIGTKIEQYLRRQRIDAPAFVDFDAIESIACAVALGRGVAITTPTLLLQGLRTPHDVHVHALPRPGLQRDFALVSRTGELGPIPAGIAELARRITREQLVPRIATLAPGLEATLQIAGPATVVRQ